MSLVWIDFISMNMCGCFQMSLFFASANNSKILDGGLHIISSRWYLVNILMCENNESILCGYVLTTEASGWLLCNNSFLWSYYILLIRWSHGWWSLKYVMKISKIKWCDEEMKCFISYICWRWNHRNFYCIRCARRFIHFRYNSRFYLNKR